MNDNSNSPAINNPGIANTYIPKSTNTVNIPQVNEQARIDKFNYRYCMLNDDFYNQVALELGNIYKDATELGLITQIDDTNNVYRMVMEELSKAYDKAPIREFNSDQELMEALYKDLHFDKVMAQINLYTNAFNDCLLQIGAKDGMLKLKIRRPDTTIVMTDDDNDLTRVCIFLSKTKEGKSTWAVYTPDEIYQIETSDLDDLKYDENLKEEDKKPLNGADDMSNPLNSLDNFISFHSGFRDDMYWQKYKGDDLVKGTIHVAVKMTFLNHIIKMQSFKQLVASGSNIKTMADMVIDPKTVLFIQGNETKLDVLDLSSDYDKLQDTIDKINNKLAANYKISPNTFRLTGSPSSGFSLKMENLKLDQFVTEQQDDFKTKENEIVNKLKFVSDTLGLNIVGADSVTTVFPIISYPKTEKELLDEQDKRIEMGLNSPVEYIAEERNVTEEEANTIYEDNLSDRNKGNSKLNQGSLNLQTTSTALEEANNE